jgi:hypothetical protein
MAANDSTLLNIYDKLNDTEKEEFLIFVVLKDDEVLLKLARKYKGLIEQRLCSEGIFFCSGCCMCFIEDNRCNCVGCNTNYCFECVSSTFDNNKSKGWYCCRNELCQQLYDNDKK